MTTPALQASATCLCSNKNPSVIPVEYFALLDSSKIEPFVTGREKINEVS